MEGLWPLVIMWILFSILGAKKKKDRQSASGNRQSEESPEAGPRSLPDQFRLALEELKRAEAEAMGQRLQNTESAPPTQPARRQSTQPMSYQPRTFTPRQQQKQKQKPKATARPVVLFDDDPSSEDVSTVEGLADYDTEAEVLIEARRRAADRLPDERRMHSAEGLSAAQLARRASRVDVAIGGKAQHDAWHLKVSAADAAAAQRQAPGPKRNHVLGKYADGTMRSAMILKEILGTPKGQT